jgi:hypothetical protein
MLPGHGRWPGSTGRERPTFSPATGARLPKETRMGQVYTCPSCAKKIEDGQDWSLIDKQGDVEVRAHAGRCAMGAMHSFHKAPPKPAPGVVTPKKKR